jgi:hypothetical protein
MNKAKVSKAVKNIENQYHRSINDVTRSTNPTDSVLNSSLNNFGPIQLYRNYLISESMLCYLDNTNKNINLENDSIKIIDDLKKIGFRFERKNDAYDVIHRNSTLIGYREGRKFAVKFVRIYVYI